MSIEDKVKYVLEGMKGIGGLPSDESYLNELQSRLDALREKDSEMVLLPRSLTAENGAKALLIGDWSESISIGCPECDRGEDGHGEDCEVCEGAGKYEQKVVIEWTTQKDMYKCIVNHYTK